MATINETENTHNTYTQTISDLFLDNMPPELKPFPQWVVYKLGPVKPHGKRDKLPINPKTGYAAKVNDSTTWGTLDEAVEATAKLWFDGIGFVFTEGDPFIGIDLDGCRNPQTGHIEPWAMDIVQRLDSYTEASPSDTGVHILAKGKLPTGGGKAGQVEMYGTGRFFTMTGAHIGGTPTMCEERQDAITDLYGKHFPHKTTGNGFHNGKSTHADMSEAERRETLAELRAALPFIPADEYDTWLKVGMGLHFLDSGKASFDVWVAWSKTCLEKFNHNDCRKHWVSFHNDGGITHKTIFALAINEGWQSHDNGSVPPDPDWGDHTEGKRPENSSEGLPPRGEFSPIIRCAKDIKPEIVEYLWFPYFPLGKMSLLGGDSGAGKSYLTSAIATSHSRGRWPFFTNGHETARTPGTTLILSAEDGVADTYIPRLMNLGADLSFIHFVEGKRDWQGNLHRVLLNDKRLLIRMIQEYNAKLVMFDPLQSFLPPKTKMNDMETVRPVLDALIEASQVTGCHIKLVGHLSKARQETAGYKFLGSVDWFNACRSAMLIVKNPENPDTERFFYHVKHSLGPKAPGRSFSIAEENSPIFSWGQCTDVTVEDVLAGNSKRNSSKEAEAINFLTSELKDGPRVGTELELAAKEQLHLSRSTLWEAKKRLKIQSHKGKGEFSSQWFWSLPESYEATNDTF